MATRRRTAIAVACALLAPLALAAEGAGAAERWSVRGAGWGHGIGMSQWGAYGQARRGRSYREILSHYYTGIRIARRSPSLARVLLQPNRSRVSFTGATRAGGRRLKQNSVYGATRSGSRVVLRSSSGRRLATYSGVMPVVGGATVRLLGKAENGVTDGIYRGTIDVRTARGPGLNAINTLSLEHYVQGVVPAESPPIWPPAALQAQSVAARTYALATSVQGNGFDQYADTRSQVYRGYREETPSTNSAVAETRGEVVTYGGRVVVTYFFSTSGGHTENVENVFLNSAPHPWLRGVEDPYDGASPHHRWGPVTWSSTTIDRKLGTLVRGRFRDLDVTRRGVSPRVVRARISGTRGGTSATGPQLRARLDLRDTWFYLRRVSTSSSAAQARTARGTRDLRALYGAVEPVPGRYVRLQRAVRGGWRTVELVPVQRAARRDRARYRIHVAEPGRYRILAGWAPGPPVDVRP